MYTLTVACTVRPMKLLVAAVENLVRVLDEEGDPNPVEMVTAQPVIADAAARLTTLAKSKQAKVGQRLLDEAAVWRPQFEARTHDVTGFGLFLAKLVNEHGLSLRQAGELVGIANASGVKSRIEAVAR